MTRLIKSRDAADRVRPVPVTRPSAPPPTQTQLVDAETVALRRKVEMLSQALRDRDTEITLLRGDLDRAFTAGEAQGRALELKEDEARRAAALKALEAGLGRALYEITQDLRGLERLAVQLALEGLSKIVERSDERTALVAEIIRKQVAELETASIVRIDVAHDDFGDPAALQGLAESLGYSGLALGATDDLNSGDCRIKLVLGGLEVGVDQQWSRIKETLQDLAHPGGA